MNKITKITIGLILSALILITSTVFLLNKSETYEPKEVIVYVDREANETIEDFNKKAAYEALKEIIEESSVVDYKEEDIGTDTKLKDISEKLNKMIIVNDSLKDLEGAIAKVVLNVSRYIVEESKNVVEANDSTIESLVYMNVHSRSAHIPLDIFTGSYSGYSMEMVYTSEGWKLSPYTLMESLQLAEIIINSDKGE